MVTLHFWLDFDGCANGAIKVIEHPPGSGRWGYYADVNHPLLVDMILTIYTWLRTERQVEIIISSASNRQTFEYEVVLSQKNMQRPDKAFRETLVACASTQALTAIYQMIRDYFLDDPRVTILLDRYLLEDSFLSQSPGTTWEDIGKYINQANKYPLTIGEVTQLDGEFAKYNPRDRCVNYFDNEKLVLFYSKAQRAVASATSPKVVAYYYDDNVTLLQTVEEISNAHPDFLPEEHKFSLNLRHYDSTPAILGGAAARLVSHINLLWFENWGVNSGLRGHGKSNRTWHQALHYLKGEFDEEMVLKYSRDGAAAYQDFYGNSAPDAVGNKFNLDKIWEKIRGNLIGYVPHALHTVPPGSDRDGFIKIGKLSGATPSVPVSFTHPLLTDRTLRFDFGPMQMELQVLGARQATPGIYDREKYRIFETTGNVLALHT